MKSRILRILLLIAIGIAVVWLVVDPSPEPLITAITGLVAVFSLQISASESPALPKRDQPARRIAVLPLRNITPVAERAYFADGLTEELVSVLSRIRQLEIIAASSTSRYRNTSQSISEIAAELGVGTVLEGSVRTEADALRVSVRLVDVRTQTTLWAEDYDRYLHEVFTVQRDVATHVARALQVTILADESVRIESPPTADLDAYELYLLGRHELNRRSEVGVRRSIARFRAATAKDPTFAAAHAGIADAHVLAAIGYAPIPKEVAFQEARAAAAQAIRTQETLAEAHTSLGFVLMNFDWNWAGAQAEFERALELNPSDARAYQWFAQCYSYQGRPEQAIPLTERAQELDPRSALIATEAGWPYLYLGRLEEADTQFRRALDLDPDFALAHFNLGNVLEARGDLEGALANYEKAAVLSGHAPMFVAFVARAKGLLGHKDDARHCLRSVIEAVDAGAALSVYVAYAYEGLGDRGEALRWLDRTIDSRDLLTIAIGSAWLPFETLRGSERYQAIIQRIPTGTLARPLAS